MDQIKRLVRSSYQSIFGAENALHEDSVPTITSVGRRSESAKQTPRNEWIDTNATTLQGTQEDVNYGTVLYPNRHAAAHGPSRGSDEENRRPGSHKVLETHEIGVEEPLARSIEPAAHDIGGPSASEMPTSGTSSSRKRKRGKGSLEDVDGSVRKKSPKSGGRRASGPQAEGSGVEDPQAESQTAGDPEVFKINGHLQDFRSREDRDTLLNSEVPDFVITSTPEGARAMLLISHDLFSRFKLSIETGRRLVRAWNESEALTEIGARFKEYAEQEMLALPRKLKNARSHIERENLYAWKTS